MKIWESFLPVKTSIDVAQPDAAWCAARGVETNSATILRQIRDEVGPVVERSYFGSELEWFSFLIHNRESGVPTDDDRLYIHLRMKLGMNIGVDPGLGKDWLWTREVDLSTAIAGVNPDVLDVEEAWLQLAWQSNWLLRFLQALKPGDDVEIVKHTRQFLHFFSNMAQMRVA